MSVCQAFLDVDHLGGVGGDGRGVRNVFPLAVFFGLGIEQKLQLLVEEDAREIKDLEGSPEIILLLLVLLLSRLSDIVLGVPGVLCSRLAS